MSDKCRHTVTRTREGSKSSFCDNCGFERLKVFDRPCKECKHFKTLFDGSICSRHLMRVTPDMNVCYTCNDDGTDDLCFLEST